MWPEMSDYRKQYPAGKYTLPGGAHATLYSPMDYQTVLRHFQWMRQYGLDGVWLQRFVVDLPGGPEQREYRSMEVVRAHVQQACAETDRVWALAYDLAAMPTDRIFNTLTSDWESLTAKGILDDPHYLYHDGKPVLLIWGFYSHDSHNLMTPALGNRFIDYFKDKGIYLVGGAGWWWYRDTDPQWRAMYRRLDTICGWNVGNWRVDDKGKRWADITNYAAGKAAAEGAGIHYLPIVYPGYSWSKSTPGNFNLLPRLGGEFYWKQWVALRQAGYKTAYLAMFDEVDEGTAIYKVTNTPPGQGHFVTCDGYPSDWYLRLAGAGCRMLRRQIPLTRKIPLNR
jgi:hypothetical protein